MRLALEALSVDFVDFLGAGRPSCKPSAFSDNFQSFDRSLVAWSPSEFRGDSLACEVRFLDRLWGELFQFCFLLRRGGRIDARVVGSAELFRHFPIVFAGILAGAGGNFGRQQVHDWSVFVGRPHRPIEAKKARSGTLFSSEAVRAVHKSRNEPLETYRNFAQIAAKLLDHAVNHAAAYKRFSNSNVTAP